MRLSGKTTALVLCVGWLAWASADGGSMPTNAVTPNDFNGSDVQRINRAIEVAAAAGKRVVIPRENFKGVELSEIWLLDSAILLRSNTTLELDNCRIKLSDRCRDNMMRNVYVRDGITTNLHVRGIGNVVLEGADHPRATGDSGKTLGKHTYGTDAGVAGQSQLGGTRNFGIFLTFVEDFSLEGFTIKDPHCYAIDLQQCARGTLRNLGFDSWGFKMIDGVRRQIVNQDGIDLRQGCHDILIENISGYTGDDVIALNNAGGRSDAGGRNDIHHITMRNINGYSGPPIVLLLNNGGVKIHDILIDGLTDINPFNIKKDEPAWRPSAAAVMIGSPAFGGIAPVGDTCNVTIRNVTSRSRYAILIAGSLSESTISNVVHYGTNEPVTVTSGPEYVRNVTITDVRRITNSFAAELTVPRLESATDREAVGVALQAQAPHTVLDDTRPVAQLRFLVAGDQLCVTADVEDPKPVQLETVGQGACLEVFGSMPDSQTIGHVFLVPAVGTAPSKAYRNEAGKPVLAPDIEVSSEPIARGYRLEAHIPLARLAIDPAKDQCLLEFQVTTTGAPDAAGPRIDPAKDLSLLDSPIATATAPTAAGPRTPLHVTLFKSRQAHLDNGRYARVHLKALPP